MAVNTFTDAPKQAKLQLQPCTRTDGKKTHAYVDGTCKFCGFKNPYKQRSGAVAREKGPNRPSIAAVSQAKARSIIFGAGALSQRLALQLIEEEKRGEWEKDALSAEELLLLSDALADEAIRSKRIMSWLAALDKVGPHAKLMTVLVILALPRMARHGLIPEEIASELANAAAMAMASGRTFDSNRGDGVGEVDAGGRRIVTTPEIPHSPEDENGSGKATGSVHHPSSEQEPQDSNGYSVRPDRTEAEPTDDRSTVPGDLPGPTIGLASGRMERIRRRRVVPGD